MSYYMMSGLGQTMHQGQRQTLYRGGGERAGIAVPGVSVYKGAHGYGACPPIESPPIGPAYHRINPAYVYGAGAGPQMHSLRGFGAVDANTVCSDWLAGGSGDNAAGTRAAKAIQAQLNSAGYGPIAVDGIFGDASIAAWNRFAAAKGQTSGWPDCAGITVLMGTGGASKAGMLMGLGLLALVAVGAAALLAKKKHGAAAHHKGHGTDRLIIEEKRA